MKLLVILLVTSEAIAIWPPGYSVNLTQEGTFVISEDIQSDVEDVYSDEDEMIKEKDLQKFALQRDTAKYYQIHRMAMQYNKVYDDKKNKMSQDNVKIFESNFDREEPLPWEAGFVDKEGNFLDRVQKDSLLTPFCAHLFITEQERSLLECNGAVHNK